MTRVTIVEDCVASAESAFAYVNDYRNLPNFLHGLESFTPVGSKDEGLGAVFDGRMKLGPVALTSRVEVTRWERDTVIAVTSVKGFKVSGTFVFHPKAAALCTVDATVDYRVPDGLAGKALSRTIEPFVRIAVRHTTDNLVTRIAAFHLTREP